MSEYPVHVYIYDLSRGFASQMSLAFLGKHIEGVWHTGIVAYGREWYYGGGGIESCNPCGTVLGRPNRIEDLGNTQIPEEMFMDYLQEMAESKYRPESYHILDNNCNCFSADVALFLTGTGIPSYVIDLPREFLATPLGQMVKPLLDHMGYAPGGGHKAFYPENCGGGTSNLPLPSSSTSASTSSSTSTSSSSTAKPVAKPDSVVFHDYDVDASVSLITSTPADLHLSEAEIKLMKEIHEYSKENEHELHWSLGATHITLLLRLLNHGGRQSLAILDVLQCLVVRQEIRCLLDGINDRQFIKYVHSLTEDRPARIKTLKVLSNFAASEAGSKRLFSKTEWQHGSDKTSNAKVVVALTVESLLRDDLDFAQPAATLVFNMAINHSSLAQLEDEILELSSAILHMLGSCSTDSQTTKCCIQSLLRFISIDSQVLVPLINAHDIDWNAFGEKDASIKPFVLSLNFKLQDAHLQQTTTG